MAVDDSYQRRLIRWRQMPVAYVIHFKLKLLTGPASVSAKCQYNVMNLSTHHISPCLKFYEKKYLGAKPMTGNLFNCHCRTNFSQVELTAWIVANNRAY